MTAEQALASHGFTWERLEKLAAAALRKCMRDSGTVLDADRKADVLEFYVEVGARWARRYDPELAGGVSFASSCFRRMYPKLFDFLRRRGDERRGTPLEQVPTDPALLPSGSALDELDSFDEEVEALASTLPDRSRWTLKNLGQPIAEEDLPLAEAAHRAGITVEYAEELLEELGWRLGRNRRGADVAVDVREEFFLMQAWSAA